MEMTSVSELQPFRLVAADIRGCDDSSYDENHPLNIDAVVELIEKLCNSIGAEPLAAGRRQHGRVGRVALCGVRGPSGRSSAAGGALTN